MCYPIPSASSAHNQVVTTMETVPGSGIALGWSSQGGAGVGGTGGTGVVIVFNWADIVQVGAYETVGGGSYEGASASVTIDVSILPYNDINQFSGNSFNVGGSVSAEFLNFGAETGFAMLPDRIEWDNPYVTLSIGVGGGSPVDGHQFINHTFVQGIGSLYSGVAQITSGFK